MSVILSPILSTFAEIGVTSAVFGVAASAIVHDLSAMVLRCFRSVKRLMLYQVYALQFVSLNA